ncbi:hypothetical protein CP520_03460 [Mesoplasma lactucae ATCC 49193]|uniref:Uncharacterized protein n=2 Tax=Mesoplasma lactucae TaxID=138853 RepID=A0A291ISR5_9MOLU|nr:hypothetical protein CP520_03460 [Mesoplasma lactucae ATCC 49193]
MSYLHEIRNDDELKIVTQGLEEPAFVIFSDWYKQPYSPKQGRTLQISISYWPDALLLDLWNPETTHNSKGIIVGIERVDAILHLQSFEKNLRRYGIPLKTFVIEQEDAQFFSKQNRPAKEVDPERLLELEEKRKAIEERNKRFDHEISGNQDKYDLVFSYLAYMASLFLQKVVFTNPKLEQKFKNIEDINIQKYIFENLMWIFLNDKSSIAKTLNIDLSSNKVKYIYDEYLFSYTQNYFENNYKIVFDKNLPNFNEQRRLMLMLHRYSEYFDDEILKQGLAPDLEEFFTGIDDYIKAINDSDEKFNVENDAKLVPTAKAIERTATKDVVANLQYFIKGFAFQASDILSAYNLSVKHSKKK